MPIDRDDDKPDRFLIPNDRVIQRGQGCWNCKHKESAVKWWTERRQHDLTVALGIANDSPEGEDALKCANIKAMVNTTDHNVASGALVRCTNAKAKTASGDPIGDLVAHNFLCGQWSGAQGASLAREGKLDELPEEVADKLDGGKPQSLDSILGNKTVN
jgi:hypothetical protein